MRKSTPAGAGWQKIPGGKKGGYRKRSAKGWDYWYPEGSAAPAEASKPARPASPLRDDDRGPLTLYQGNDARTMHSSPDGGQEYGIFLTPKRSYAQQYGANLHRTWVKLAKPKVVENKGEISPANLTQADVAKLQAQGYDGIIVKPKGASDAKASEVIVFSSDAFIPYDDLNAFSAAKDAVADYDYEHGSVSKSLALAILRIQCPGIPLVRAQAIVDSLTQD